MTVKHTPATPLPFHFIEGNGEIVSGSKTVARLHLRSGAEQDGRYFTHAANAYPKLVEALRGLASECQNCEERFAPTGNAALDLLREIGEQ